MNRAMQPAQRKHMIAAFDFDGTSIQGNSPVLLVRYLMAKNMLSTGVVARIALWALAYKFQLPQNEAGVRGLVFTAFEGRPKEQVDAFLRQFYDEVVEGQKRFRPEAECTMRALEERGIETLIVSASFGPIVRRAQELHGFMACVCTEMKVDAHGCYTREVDGDCIEGEAKVRAIVRYANERYGEGNWELAYAFGDHHSDVPMLQMATYPCVVNPDNPLDRTAKRRGWTEFNWKVSPDKH